MAKMTISSKFQVVIPKEIRESLNLCKGQKLVAIVKGGIIHLIPEKKTEELRGFLHGMSCAGLREEADRS